MDSSPKTFIILDGNALLHRAWHAIPPLTTKTGVVVNAVYGFTNVVEKMLGAYKPDYMAVAWDLPGGTFRNEEFAEYKATREKKADELYAQIPLIQEVMAAYGIPSLSAKGFEADDIIGTISRDNDRRKNIQTLIVTGDLDSLQLVTHRTKVLFFVKGLSEVKIYDEDAVKERYGLEPKSLIDLKTLIGDKSDNLPGVPGIGEKGAADLLKAYGSVDGILKAAADGALPDKFAKKFAGQEKHVALMRRLVTIVCDVPLKDYDFEQTITSNPDKEKLLQLFRDLEFKTLIKKYEGTVEGAMPKPTAKKKSAKQTLVTSLSNLSTNRVAAMVDMKAQDLFGGGIATLTIVDGKQAFVAEEPTAEVLQSVVDFLSRCSVVVAHDVKAFMHLMDQAKFPVDDIFKRVSYVDTMIAAYLLSAGDRAYEFADVVQSVYGTAAKVPPSPAERAQLLLEMSAKLIDKLEADGMSKLYRDIELPLVRVLFGMERAGIMVDKKKLASLSESFGERLNELTKKIYKEAGKEFNINSPSQLAEILFETLGLPTKGVKKTKNGFSTAASELEKLEHPIISLIEDYREIAKLKSTYADTLPALVAPDGRIHTSFNQTVAATGRLSSTNPNMQNMPIKTDLGLEIRKAFVAPKEYVLMSADYSQIELRLAAHIAKDASLMAAFKEGADIHRRTAAEVWEIPEERVTKLQRAAAKAINFSILYGVGPRSLARATGLSFEEAKQFIERYFEVHRPIREYMDAQKLKARTDGYVESLFGRRRYLPDIHSGVHQLVAAAERMAINMPVQGTQADILKMAMIKIQQWIEESGLDVKMLLQVHDELVFEVAEKDVKKAEKAICDIMGSIMDLEVPLVVDVGAERRWGDIS